MLLCLCRFNGASLYETRKGFFRVVFSRKTQNIAYEARRMCFVRASIFQTFQNAFASQNIFVFDVCIARVSSRLDSKIQSVNRFSIRPGKWPVGLEHRSICS